MKLNTFVTTHSKMGKLNSEGKIYNKTFKNSENKTFYFYLACSKSVNLFLIRKKNSRLLKRFFLIQFFHKV